MHKESTKRYNKLTESTKEGIFVNIVDKDNCEHVIENVELVMAIHKKDRNPIVTELTESALQN
jgi:Tfp pilus assembly protein PilZ